MKSYKGRKPLQRAEVHLTSMRSSDRREKNNHLLYPRFLTALTCGVLVSILINVFSEESRGGQNWRRLKIKNINDIVTV